MYQNENFEEVGKVQGGELIMRLPGTNLKMHHTAGTGYVNQTENVAYLALDVNDLTAEDSGEPAEEMLGMLGQQMKEQIDQVPKEMIEVMLTTNPIILFYSKTPEGKSVLTRPGMSENEDVDKTNFKDCVVAAYSTSGSVPSPAVTYLTHCKATAGEELVSDRSELEKDMLALADKANATYSEGLEIIEQQGF